MMLKPERLAANYSQQRKGLNRLEALSYADAMAEQLDAQQARIAELEAQLNRIQRLADCGTVQNWLALPDEDKARWFAITAQRDSEHCKLIAELEQDAARYRWLRDVESRKSDKVLVRIATKARNGWSYTTSTDNELDAAIDAAMQK